MAALSKEQEIVLSREAIKDELSSLSRDLGGTCSETLFKSISDKSTH